MSDRMQSMYSNYVEGIRRNQRALAENRLTYLPYDTVSRYLGRVIGGLERQDYVLFTATTGVGKSITLRNLFVMHPVLLAMTTPGIEVRVLYNAMEESPRHIFTGLMSHYLSQAHQLLVEKLVIKGKSGQRLSEREMQLIEGEASRFFREQIIPRVELVNMDSPRKFIRFVLQDACRRGKFYTDAGIRVPNPWEASFDRYLPDDPGLYYIILSDHMGFYQEGSDQHKTLKKFSQYCRNTLCLKMDAIVVNVQQQSSETERSQFARSGERIHAKHEPSLGNLGDMKLSQRDATIIMGLHDPLRFNQMRHRCVVPGGRSMEYDASLFRGYYRALYLLKNRDGASGIQVPFFFNPKTELLEELPPVVNRQYILEKLQSVGIGQDT